MVQDRMVTTGGQKKYSSIIQLYSRLTDFELTNIINPFNTNLTFDITVAENSLVTSELIDMSGRTVSSKKQLVYAGTNSINLGTQSLPAGIYTLRVVNKNKYLVKRRCEEKLNPSIFAIKTGIPPSAGFPFLFNAVFSKEKPL